MTIISAPANPGPWCDTNTVLTVRTLDALRAAGRLGVARYVPLPGNNPAGDISAEELGRVLGEGLQLLLVQHVRAGDTHTHLWDPGVHSGEDDARAACAAAKAAGYPEGAHLYLDLEAVGGTKVATVGFCLEWQRIALAEGYRAGLYVGYSVPLSPVDLYELAGFDSYWSDAGRRQVATRGCAIVQGAEVTIGGVKFDLDTMSADGLGGLPMVATAG